MYLVIDTWVWAKAGELKSPESLALLLRIWKKCEHKIIYDYEEKILAEYKKHIRPLHIAKIFRIMTQIGKLVPKAKSSIIIENFDESDQKFIQVAIAVPYNTLIVSGNSDFLTLREQLKEDEELGRRLRIVTPEEALGIL